MSKYEITSGTSLSARRAWIEIMQTKKEKTPHPVALRKESVDRNPMPCTKLITRLKSLSARRAWIEMPCRAGPLPCWMPVALRKESVDRNPMPCTKLITRLKSLSARRAWIEMPCRAGPLPCWMPVALRKESVDRNKDNADTVKAYARRSPQGERG